MVEKERLILSALDHKVVKVNIDETR